MLSNKITVDSGLVLRVVVSVLCSWTQYGSDMCSRRVGMVRWGTLENQLNVLPFSVKTGILTDILHIIAPSLRGCTSSLSKHASQEVH